jgi:hypothetical protein
LKKFLSIDGNGATVFFRFKFNGPSVTAANDIGLGAIMPDATFRLLAREGNVVQGKTVTLLGTLIGAKGTLAENRWRAGADAIGVRLSFSGKTQAVYTIPTSATGPDQWILWAQSGDAIASRGAARTFGLPGFGPDNVAYTTQLAPPAAKANDTLLLRENALAVDLLAVESGPVPGPEATPLPGLRFKQFLDPISGANGQLAFIATIAGPGVRASNRSGIWFAGSDGVLRLLARAGDPAPGGGRWAAFESLALPDGNESAPLFTATLAIDGGAGISRSNRRGLWAADSAGTLRLLLRAGQTYTVNGAPRVIKAFVALAPAPGSLGAAQGLDGSGNVTALVTFIDGTEAVLTIGLP